MGPSSIPPLPPMPVARAQRTKLEHGRYARAEATGASFLLKSEAHQFDLFRLGWRALPDPQVRRRNRVPRLHASSTACIKDRVPYGKELADIQHYLEKAEHRVDRQRLFAF